MQPIVEAETIPELLQALSVAHQRYYDAKTSEDSAARERVSALNECNNLQKRLDEAIANLAGSAPPETNWGRKLR